MGKDDRAGGRGEAVKRASAIAEAVRMAAESEFTRSRVLSNRCMLLSVILAEKLHQVGIAADLVGGSYSLFPEAVERPEFGNPEHVKAARYPYKSVPHCWVQIGETIIDITATQFDSELPSVFVTDKSNPHYRGRERVSTATGRKFIENYGLQEHAENICEAI